MYDVRSLGLSAVPADIAEFFVRCGHDVTWAGWQPLKVPAPNPAFQQVPTRLLGDYFEVTIDDIGDGPLVVLLLVHCMLVFMILLM